MFCVYECGGYCVRMESPYIRCGVDSCEYSYPQKQTTNADRIRAMSDEEMARNAATLSCPKSMRPCKYVRCKDCWLEWLQQPAEEDDHA